MSTPYNTVTSDGGGGDGGGAYVCLITICLLWKWWWGACLAEPWHWHYVCPLHLTEVDKTVQDWVGLTKLKVASELIRLNNISLSSRASVHLQTNKKYNPDKFQSDKHKYSRGRNIGAGSDYHCCHNLSRRRRKNTILNWSEQERR